MKYQFFEEIAMYAQAAIKLNPLLRNGAYGIVMRGVQKCTRGCSSLRGRKRLPLCCIKLDTATDIACGTGAVLLYLAQHGIFADGTDLSEAMCRVADEKAKKAGERDYIMLFPMIHIRRS